MNIQEQYQEETGLYHYDSGSMDFKWSDDYVDWLEKRIEALTIPVVSSSTLLESNKKLKKALHQIYTMQDGWVGEHVDKTKKIIQATFKND